MSKATKPIFYTGGGVINSGPKASELLRELGATNTFIYSNVKHLLVGFKNYFRNMRPLVFYLRGDEISFDLKADLLRHDFNCEEHVVYKQRRNIQKKELGKILSGENLEGIALFSEKSVDSLIMGAPHLNLDKIFFCFSKKIENRLRSVLDKDIRCKTIQEPLISEMVKMIVKEYARY